MKSLPCLAITLLLAGCLGFHPTPHVEFSPSSAFLTNLTFSTLEIRVLAMAGSPPSDAALYDFAASARLVSGKSAVHLLPTRPLDVSAPANRTWTDSELYAALTKAGLWGFTRGDVAQLTVAYFDGSYSGAVGHTVGVSVGNGVVAIFPDDLRHPTVGSFEFPNVGDSSHSEYVVLLHEFGHAIGLVDAGLPMVHAHVNERDRDPCRCHSRNPDSVMYAGADLAETLQAMVLQGGKQPDQFDADDWADIHAYQAAHRASP